MSYLIDTENGKCVADTGYNFSDDLLVTYAYSSAIGVGDRDTRLLNARTAKISNDEKHKNATSERAQQVNIYCDTRKTAPEFLVCDAPLFMGGAYDPHNP